MARIKYAIVGAIAIGVLASGVGSAAAAPAAGSTTFNATSTNFQVTRIGTAANIKCGNVSFSGTLAGGKATTNSITFANCVNVFYNLKVEVTAANPWELTFAKGSSGNEVTSFNGVNLRVKMVEIPTCTYDIFGKASSTTPSSTISSWNFVESAGQGPMVLRYPTNTCKGMDIREVTGVGGYVVGSFAVTPPITVG